MCVDCEFHNLEFTGRKGKHLTDVLVSWLNSVAEVAASEAVLQCVVAFILKELAVLNHHLSRKISLSLIKFQ